mgnify:CR=1 FL=1
MTRTLNILSVLIFSSALTVRAVDPVVPQIATDFGITPTTAASLAAAFAAYGLTLPVLGPVADAVGKVKVMLACLVILTITSLMSVVASEFWVLLVIRIVAGAACGGSFPIAMAIVSDLVPVAQRQVVIGRLLIGTISGNLLGAALSGIIADFVHWRGVFVVLGCVTAAALALGAWGLRGLPEAPRQTLHVLAVISRYRDIFRIRTARICYMTVALEGFFLFGVFPYVAVLLLARFSVEDVGAEVGQPARTDELEELLAALGDDEPVLCAKRHDVGVRRTAEPVVLPRVRHVAPGNARRAVDPQSLEPRFVLVGNRIDVGLRDEVDVHRVEHQFDAHEQHQRIAAHHDAHQADGEEHRRQHEVPRAGRGDDGEGHESLTSVSPLRGLRARMTVPMTAMANNADVSSNATT